MGAMKETKGFKGMQSLLSTLPIKELEEMLANIGVDVT